jgi:outer membrane protein
MKHLFVFAVSLLLATASVNAQRYAIIDTKYILDKMPEYKDADKKLVEISDRWQKEIDDKQGQLNQMYRNFDAEQFMLSEDLRKKEKSNSSI